MKVVLVSEHASPAAVIGGVDAGGQNIYVGQVARCLAQRGHQVEVLTRRDSAASPSMLDLPCGTRVVNIDAGPASFLPKEQLLPYMDEFALRSERYLADTARERGHRDVVHANFFMSGLVADHLKQSLALPYVVTFHALGLVRRQHQKEADGFPDERIDIERMLVQRADQVIAECPQDKADLVDLYGADSRRTATIPCGFDAGEFAPMDRTEARRRLGIAVDEFIVLQLGRLVPRKGIDNVIRAMGLLPPGLKARLLVVGGDAADPGSMGESAKAEVARLRRVADEAGVGARVGFVGHRQRPDLRSYYAAADVFVTTPWYEPFGITPLEAMACGRAVVGSDVGGIKHSVVDEVTGFLVPPDAPRPLADRLMRLCTDEALKDSMGAAGLQRARSLFTWEQVTERLMDVYGRIVAHSNAVPAVVQIARGSTEATVAWAAAA
ncbi:glycosyltransferase family 1 protein [soil metagenome]